TTPTFATLHSVSSQAPGLPQLYACAHSRSSSVGTSSDRLSHLLLDTLTLSKARWRRQPISPRVTSTEVRQRSTPSSLTMRFRKMRAPLRVNTDISNSQSYSELQRPTEPRLRFTQPSLDVTSNR